MRIVSLLLLVGLISSGCYHATVVTGKTPGPVKIDQPFALGFVYGLVPPSTVETMERCPAGVAMVETKLSFLNAVVSNLTFGILTPMHITVTCAAAGSAELVLPSDATEVSVRSGADAADVQAVFGDAADEAVATNAPVYVRFE